MASGDLFLLLLVLSALLVLGCCNNVHVDAFDAVTAFKAVDALEFVAFTEGFGYVFLVCALSIKL
jgi:hypothetical protein